MHATRILDSLAEEEGEGDALKQREYRTKSQMGFRGPTALGARDARNRVLIGYRHARLVLFGPNDTTAYPD